MDATQTGRSVVVVTAGLRQPSSSRLLADRLAAAVERHLAARGVDARVELVEVRELAHDLTNNVLTGFPSPPLRAAIDRVAAADGLVVVSPIFNASYSGLFKLFFDVLDRDALAEMPVLLAATGGTARHSLALEHALRPLFAYLGAASVPTGVFAAPEDWGEGDAAAVPRDDAGTEVAEPGLAGRIDRAAAQLASAVAARDPRTRTDPFADPTPFEQLLSGRPD